MHVTSGGHFLLTYRKTRRLRIRLASGESPPLPDFETENEEIRISISSLRCLHFRFVFWFLFFFPLQSPSPVSSSPVQGALPPPASGPVSGLGADRKGLPLLAWPRPPRPCTPSPWLPKSNGAMWILRTRRSSCSESLGTVSGSSVPPARGPPCFPERGALQDALGTVEEESGSCSLG